MKNRKQAKVPDQSELSKQDRAQKAMFNRSRKESSHMTQYYYVIGFFCLICLLSVVITLWNPKQNFSDKDVIDQQDILIHNGQGHQFKHGENKVFEKKTLKDAKNMFMSALSDTNNISHCKTAKKVDEKAQGDDFVELEIEIPESYDWREVYPQCVQPVMDIG